jgi:hypothetical protein
MPLKTRAKKENTMRSLCVWRCSALVLAVGGFLVYLAQTNESRSAAEPKKDTPVIEQGMTPTKKAEALGIMFG